MFNYGNKDFFVGVNPCVCRTSQGLQPFPVAFVYLRSYRNTYKFDVVPKKMTIVL